MSQVNGSVAGLNLELRIIEEGQREERVEGMVAIIPESHTIEMGRGMIAITIITVH